MGSEAGTGGAAGVGEGAEVVVVVVIVVAAAATGAAILGGNAGR